MTTEILTTIKKTLGISQEDYSFDTDLIIFINATMMILSQLGVVEADNMIISQTTTWKEFFGDRTDLEVLKTYIHFKVKQMFDPPTSTAAIESVKQITKELEWRITNMSTIESSIKV